MKKSSFISLCLLMCSICINANASIEDSTAVREHHSDKGIFTYSPERGYFQKAFTDPGDPRFMMSNEDETFSFGVGGIIHFTAFEDFAGSLDNYGFTTYNISVPSDYTPQFGMSVAGSRFFFKGRAKVGKRSLVGVLEVKTSMMGNSAGIRLAYASYGAVTLGQTYSFFMDLEAGPMTVDLQGPNTQINNIHPLIGITLPVNHWTFAAAAELSEFSFTNDSYYNQFGIADSYQSMPDFTTRIQYKNDFGHIQLAGILRQLYYNTFDRQIFDPVIVRPTDHNVNLNSHVALGYGLSLSGKINMGSSTFFTFQGTFGRGISKYYNDLQDASINLVRKGITGDDTSQMTCLYSYGGYLALQHQWSDKLCSSIMYGFMGIPNQNNAYQYDYDKIYRNAPDYMSAFKSSQYFAINLFWNYSKYGSMGIEYTHGFRTNFTPSIIDNKSTTGQAGRLTAMFMYTF